MHCNELQKRLNKYSGKIEDLSAEILAHLKVCKDCSRFAGSSFKLSVIMQTVSDNRVSDLMPLEQRMKMVVREAESSNLIKKIIEFSNRLEDALSFGYSRLVIYSSLVSMVLILVTLVPFGYSQVVGYNLTIGGICPEVADDDEIVRALLYEQGISQAIINVTKCDTTCSLMIFDLQSEQEIELAMATYEELGAEVIIEDIAIITDCGRRSLLSMARDKIFNN